MRVRLKSLVASLRNGAWGDEPEATEGTYCIRAADFDYTRLRTSLVNAPKRDYPRAVVDDLRLRLGDLVLEKSGGGEHQPVGRAVLYDHDDPAVATNFAARLRPAPGVDPRYLTYLLAGLYASGATERCIKQTTGIQNLDTDAWLQTTVVRPPVDEQGRIADFLDDQVGRIDDAIRLREAQVRAVDDRYHSLLNQLLVPTDLGGGADGTDWADRRLRSVCHVFSDGDWIESPHITDEGIRLVQTGNVGVGEYREQGYRYISEETFAELRCTAVLPGDVLISRLSPPVARACLAPDLGVRMVASVDVVITRPDPRVVLPELLVAILSTPRHLADADIQARAAP